MSNKTQLQTNNAALDGYIARINAAKEVAATLPEVGGSGGGSGTLISGQLTGASAYVALPGENYYYDLSEFSNQLMIFLSTTEIGSNNNHPFHILCTRNDLSSSFEIMQYYVGASGETSTMVDTNILQTTMPNLYYIAT